MKKVILSVTVILTSFFLLSFNSLNNENFKSINTKNLVIEDECQEYVGWIITNLYNHSDMTLQQLSDYEADLFAFCYYDA